MVDALLFSASCAMLAAMNKRHVGCPVNRTKLVTDVLRRGPISRDTLVDEVAPQIPVEYGWECYLSDNKHPTDKARTPALERHAQKHVVIKVLRELRSRKVITEANGTIELV